MQRFLRRRVYCTRVLGAGCWVLTAQCSVLSPLRSRSDDNGEAIVAAADVDGEAGALQGADFIGEPGVMILARPRAQIAGAAQGGVGVSGRLHPSAAVRGGEPRIARRVTVSADDHA